MCFLKFKTDRVAPLIADPSDATPPLCTVDCNLFIYQTRELTLSSLVKKQVEWTETAYLPSPSSL